LLALDQGLISTTCRALTLFVLADTLKAFDLARLSGAFSLIGSPFAQIGRLLAHIGFLISLIGGSLARVGCRSIPVEALLACMQLCFAHLKLGLAVLNVDVPIFDAFRRRRPVLALCHRGSLHLGCDQSCPTAFQRRASALVRRRVAMQIRPRRISLLIPKGCRLLMRFRGVLVASFCLLVTAH
jgi:hypothetical protein